MRKYIIIIAILISCGSVLMVDSDDGEATTGQVREDVSREVDEESSISVYGEVDDYIIKELNKQ